MPLAFSRRALLLGVSCLPLAARAAPIQKLSAAEKRIADLERAHGGRLGVAVIDTATGARLAHRAGERFPMCSTFKLLATAAVLKQVDDGKVTLDRAISYGEADLLHYAPVTKEHVGDGHMMLGDLCAAALNWSDNTAANLILKQIGGPQGFTRYVRSLGDTVTRLDRIEPALNSAIPGDTRDTTSPDAMADSVMAVLLHGALSPASARQLEAWLINDKVGDRRLRAGLPPSWRIGDKTGSGDNGTANTIAIIRPPGRAPLIATVYYTGSSAPMTEREAVHAEITHVIAKTF
jgi:beta-lactamase class A